MLRTTLWLMGLAALAAASLFWFFTRPGDLPLDWGSTLQPDPAAGARVFLAGGCAACHAAPGAAISDTPVLTGGQSFPSDFGTFFAPNISPHPTEGIGGWTLQEFATALTLGVSPEGKHYYPAFPYGSYRLMQPQDVVDLFAYIQTLPPSDVANMPQQVGFPFSIRRGIGLWKAIFLAEGFVTPEPSSDLIRRGRYLAEALGHCAECHTPRTAFGGLNRANWMTGAPDPSGKGRVPGITSGQLDWSEDDLTSYFATGFTPEYDSAGGHMAKVIENLARLPQVDREALSAYVKSLP